jgi:predicted ATP-grasp superfamily ATP-dependent carboligase
MKWDLVEFEGRLDVPSKFVQKICKHYRRVNKTPVILLDMGVPALAIARHLGRRGIPIIALDTKTKHWTHKSKYIYTLVSRKIRNSNSLINVLASLTVLFEEKPILIPMHDDYVKFVTSNRELLEDTNRLVIPDESVAKSLIDKSELYQLCKKYDVPVPVTIFSDSLDDLKQQISKIKFPCIIKPAESRTWQSEKAQQILHGAKAIVAENECDLIRKFQYLSNIESRMVIQDLIQGPDSNLYYVASYVDKNGNIIGNFVGQKLRTYPAHYGRGSYVRSVINKTAVQIANKIVKELNYRGNIGVELKFDEIDKNYKLIEINARFGLWDGFSSDCGMDLINAAYTDAIGDEIMINENYKIDKHWINIEIDYKAALQYFRMGELTLNKWIRSVLNSDYSAIAAKDDIKPAMTFWVETGRYLFSRILSRLSWN